MRDLYRKIDGAVLISQLEKDLDCTITFQTHSILQRFMLRFDQLQLDCNDHLYIYDGAHAVSSYKVKSQRFISRSGILQATRVPVTSDFHSRSVVAKRITPICIQIGTPKLDVISSLSCEFAFGGRGGGNTVFGRVNRHSYCLFVSSEVSPISRGNGYYLRMSLVRV